MKYLMIIGIIGLATFTACNSKSGQDESGNAEQEELGVHAENFIKTINGKEVELYTLENKNGLKVQVTNYGGRIVSIIVPDKFGNMTDVALGYSSIDEYLSDGMNQSGIIGRYGNRIKNGKFSLNGETFTLALNNGPNSLHGGIEGFNRKVWDAKQTDNRVELSYISPDMEEGYPGELKMKVVYELSDNNEISMVYEASTNKPTIINLTNHTYFNLKGEGDTTILDHTLQINAGYFIPVDSTIIPTGKIAELDGTPFDFRKPKLIGTDINVDNEQLRFGKGYDHNWVLDKEPEELTLALKLSEATKGIVMEMYTTEPGVQFYCGNFMNGTMIGKTGRKYLHRAAVALEPQHFPDSPNNTNFPSTVLNPGESYYQKSVLKFYLKKN